MIGRITAKAGALARKVTQRFGWGLADQAMCSVSNAAVSFYVARELGATEFGAFSLAYVTYSFALTASRGLATDPFLVRFSGTNLATWRRAAAQCTGTALMAGLVTGSLALTAAAALHGAPRLAFLALGLTLPGLLLQDAWRYSFFAHGQGSKAFVNDLVWTLTLVPPLLLLRIHHLNSVFWLMTAWGAAATVAAGLGAVQARVIPRAPQAWTWVARHRDLGLRYLVENTSNSGAGQLRTYGLGAIAGLAAVGYVQAAALLMGPFMVIFLGMSLVTVPEATRILRQSPGRLHLYCVAVGVGLASLGLAWGGALLVALPRGLGSLLLGHELWRPASHLVVPYTFSVMGFCLIAGATAGLHALGAAKRSLRAMIISSVIYLGSNLAGAYLAGAVGTVRGAAVATWLGAVVWWWQLRLAMRESDQIPAHSSLRSGPRHGLRARPGGAGGRAAPPRGVRGAGSPSPGGTGGGQPPVAGGHRGVAPGGNGASTVAPAPVERPPQTSGSGPRLPRHRPWHAPGTDTPASPAPDHTAWMPQPCSSSDVVAAAMQYEEALPVWSRAQRDGPDQPGLAGRRARQGALGATAAGTCPAGEPLHQVAQALPLVRG